MNKSLETINKDYKSYPKVSVVIATYRRDISLVEALNSLVYQTYNNYEIIIVDDNYDNEWNQIIKEIVYSFKEKSNIPIIYICNERNEGSAETRNIGILECKGEYITFLDDDDIYLNNKIKNQVQHMIKEESDYSITDMWLYNKKNKLVGKRERKYIKKTDSLSILKYHILYHITGPNSMMFKKKYLLKIGMFTAIDVGDDYYLIEKAIEGAGKFSYLPVCDLKAYIHFDGSGLSSGNSKIEGENQLYKHKRKYFNLLTKREKRYVTMRHYAVIAYAELRRRKYIDSLKNIKQSFFSSPLCFINLVIMRK